MRDTAIIFSCWCVAFLFNGIESGLMSIDPVRLRYRVNRNVPDAIRLNRLLEHPERLLVTVLLVTNLADILGLLLLTRRLVWDFGAAGFLISIVISFPIYLFLLAVLPKSLFRRFPFRALVALAGLLEVISTLLWPVLEFGGLIGTFFLRQRSPEESRLFAAREEFKQITTQSEREGSLTATERAMIHNVFDFKNVKVREVMMPLAKIVSVQSDTPVEKALDLSAASGLDRLPIITPEGEATGLINILDILFDKNGARSISHYARRIVSTREDEPADLVIQRLRAARLGLGAVLDAKKKLIGFVSSEDLIRRLMRA
jgi:putative hemolysin